MTSDAPVLRTTLRAETREAIRARIVDGRLPPGANVVERDLSETLGVSRTPLREALLGLQAEGLLSLEPQRGFFVAPLSVAEARELYPLIGSLEALAVRRGRPAGVAALAAINAAFRGARDQQPAVRADRAWHEALLERCGSPRTAAILGPLRAAASRYEYRFFSGRHAILESARQHDAIADAIAHQRYARAADLLQRNWEQGLQWVERSFAS